MWLTGYALNAGGPDRLEIPRIRDVVFVLRECREGREQTYLVIHSADVFEFRIRPQAPFDFFCRQFKWNILLPSNEMKISKRICVLHLDAIVISIKRVALAFHQVMNLLRHIVGSGKAASF